MTTGPTIPRAIIDCIAQAREPNLQEFCAVAEHIWSDVTGGNVRRPEPSETAGPAARLLSFRAAHAALTGLP